MAAQHTYIPSREYQPKGHKARLEARGSSSSIGPVFARNVPLQHKIIELRAAM